PRRRSLPLRPRALDPLHLRNPPEAPEAQRALVEALTLRQRFHLAQMPPDRFFLRRRHHRVPLGASHRLRTHDPALLRCLAGVPLADREGERETIAFSRRRRDEVQAGNALKLAGVAPAAAARWRSRSSEESACPTGNSAPDERVDAQP